MTANRFFAVPSSLILGVIGISAAATGTLVAFPDSLTVWKLASWTLAVSLLILLGLVLASGYSLFTHRAARTWQRIASFLLGFACLAVIAIGSL